MTNKYSRGKQANQAHAAKRAFTVEKRAKASRVAASSTSINLNDEISDGQGKPAWNGDRRSSSCKGLIRVAVFSDDEYYGSVSFGTPAQTFPME